MTMNAAPSVTPSPLLSLLKQYPQEKLEALDRSLGWVPEWHQIPPKGDWTYWLMLGGRGSGKTDAGAHYVDAHAMGPPCMPGAIPHRIAIAAPTLGDARLTCVKGDSGILAHRPGVRFVQMDGELYWPNGAHGRIFGAYTPEDVERWRGPQHCLVWADELAAWRYLRECWEMMRFGLRLGEHPHAIGTTTGKPRPFLKDLMALPETAITRASTRQNPHLVQAVRDILYSTFAGTRLARQELEGEIVDDVQGAYWTRAQLEDLRSYAPMDGDQPIMRRIVVAVDPAVTSKADSDETGIIVCGLGVDGTGWAIADYSLRGHPQEWAAAAVRAYHRWKADRIVAEANQGGEMVALTIRTVDPNVPVKLVHASQGKRTRAEPVAALYEQKRVRHLMGADLTALEDQMCSWSAQQGEDSPDRIDALVWGLTELMLGSAWGSGQASAIA